MTALLEQRQSAFSMANAIQASIFTAAFISQRLYSRLEPYLTQIAEATSTAIEFDYKDQRFLISGPASNSCDDALANVMRLIESSGSNDIGADGMFKTYPDLPPVGELSGFGIPPSTPLSSTPTVIVPVPPVVKHINLKPAEDQENNDNIANPEEKDVNVIKAVFTFAKNVRNAQLVVSPPHQFSQMSNEYLHQIARETNTSCTLDNRSIVITGNTEKDVQDAVQRFQVLQAVHKRMKKYVNIQPVPVTHYPTKFNHFGLVFCHLPKYAHFSLVDLDPNETKPIQTFFVLIPAFKDGNGEYMRPALMVDSQPNNAIEEKFAHISASLDSASFFDAQQTVSPSVSSNATTQSVDPLPARAVGKKSQLRTLQLSASQTTIPEEPKLSAWNKLASSTHSALHTSPHPSNSKVVVMQRQSWGTAHESATVSWPSATSEQGRAKIEAKDEFPSLAGSPKKSLAKGTVASSSPKQDNVAQIDRKIRVMRLTKAPADILSPQPNLSPVEALRMYNFNTIYSTLCSAFEDIRGCKGEFQFSAVLGKVLWKNIKPEVQQQVWEYTDIRDILQKQYGSTPQFNNIATTREDVIDSISELLPQPFKRTAYYEIIANARNQPHCPYSEVVMKINSNIVDLEKVTVSHQTMAEINWVSLNRIFDFAFKLTKNDQLRTDIKPFSTFIRKVSVSVKSRNITFQNIPDFLDVKQVLFKQSQRFRIHYPFIVEITRVELLPLQHQASTGAILGHTGKGQVWFEFQVLYNEHSEHFKENLKLPAGTLTSWTAEDMLGPEETGAKLVEIVKCMLLFVEQSDRVC